MNRAKMKTITITIFGLFLLILAGCSSGESPVTPPSSPPLTGISSHTGENVQSNRYMSGLWAVTVAENHRDVEIIPLRTADMHMNAVNMLEYGMCDDCIEISIAGFPSVDEILIDVTVTHPVDTAAALEYTVFDPRLIFITAGDFEFPVNERLISQSGIHPRILNPDGYTSLFNPTEFPPSDDLPPALQYIHGKSAIGSNLSATLNPYSALAVDQPRRMFMPGSEETVQMHIKMPSGSCQFGYAVDYSWLDTGEPVTNPETDFPIEANSIEAYDISVSPPEFVYVEPGDGGEITVEIFDHQGFETIDSVFVECLALFDDEISSISAMVLSASASNLIPLSIPDHQLVGATDIGQGNTDHMNQP